MMKLSLAMLFIAASLCTVMGARFRGARGRAKALAGLQGEAAKRAAPPVTDPVHNMQRAAAAVFDKSSLNSSKPPSMTHKLRETREFLKTVVQKALVELDNKIIEATQIQARNRGAEAQVVADIERLERRVAGQVETSGDATPSIAAMNRLANGVTGVHGDAADQTAKTIQELFHNTQKAMVEKAQVELDMKIDEAKEMEAGNRRAEADVVTDIERLKQQIAGQMEISGDSTSTIADMSSLVDGATGLNGGAASQLAPPAPGLFYKMHEASNGEWVTLEKSPANSSKTASTLSSLRKAREFLNTIENAQVELDNKINEAKEFEAGNIRAQAQVVADVERLERHVADNKEIWGDSTSGINNMSRLVAGETGLNGSAAAQPAPPGGVNMSVDDKGAVDKDDNRSTMGVPYESW